MPKKKGNKKSKIANADFTIDDCANAPKPLSRAKKSAPNDAVPAELSWDQLDEDVDITEEVDEDGTKTIIVCNKKRNRSKSETDIERRPGLVYPEIVWYLISNYVKPEEIGRFAGINKATYAITKRESFWRNLYKRYCENRYKLPERLRLENSYRTYGLRQRVIRALYYTYHVFTNKVMQQATQDSEPHQLVKRRCVNVWYCKGISYWSMFFKFKTMRPYRRIETSFIEELGRIDANPEEDARVLQVTCQNFYEVPPLMGMTLSSISVVLSQGFRHHRLHLGFTTGQHISKDIMPECTVVLDTVVNISVFDWWHPRYPHFDNTLPSRLRGEEALPVLKKNFFDIRDADLF